MTDIAKPIGIFRSHTFTEKQVDLGEVRMNYATAGSPTAPALMLVPGQTESWWGYEASMALLEDYFHVFAVDLRGQGRSTWTPGRYTLDNMGKDLVRFIDTVIARKTIVSGNSSGSLLAAWLAAYAKPGQIRGSVCEDSPFFASEVNPAHGHSIRQAAGAVFEQVSKWLGDQWTVGDWSGFQSAMRADVPASLLRGMARMADQSPPSFPGPVGVPQNMKEYDPEWARGLEL